MSSQKRARAERGAMTRAMTGANAAAGIAGVLAVALATQTHAASKCPADSVRSGTGCMDKYEASIWKVPNATTTNKGLVNRIQKGKATPADLTGGGATQLGVAGYDYAPCNDNGSACADIFAVSVAGVPPSAFMTWFQAREACKNSQKRMPSNGEWQDAVTNSPDPGPDNGTTDCNSASFAVSSTGSRSSCVSSVGAFDMVGNLEEWVADWVPASTLCVGWGGFSDDVMCVSGASTVATYPGVLQRGGAYLITSSDSGPLTVRSVNGPFGATPFGGVRCVR